MPIQRPRILHASQMAGTGVVSPSNLNTLAQGSSGNKNLLINGAMQVQQRGDVTSSSTAYGLDRFRFSISNSGTVGQYQDTTVPTGKGFAKSTRIQWTSQNNSLDAVDLNYLNQPIEGQNLQHLKFGTSDAVSLTLSFWVRSNVTGNYACGLYQADGDKNFVKTYTISAADTWQHVKLTFAGNTANAIANDNTLGLEVFWGLAFGSNYTGVNSSGGWTAYGSGSNISLGYGQTANVSSSASNTWYITGAQLEVGDAATEFEHEPYATTFEKCLRYFHAVVPKGVNIGYFAPAWYYSSSTMVALLDHKVEMRSNPTVETNDGTNDFWFYRSSTYDGFNDLSLSAPSSTKATAFYNATDMSGTAGDAGGLYINDTTNAFFYLKAEL